MKHLTLLLLFFSLQQVSAQSLQTGTIIGLHQATDVQLKDGVTMEEYLKKYMEIVFPAYQEALEGIEIYNLMGLRGECQNCTGILMIMKSHEIRNKYWTVDGNWTEHGLKKLAMMRPAFESLEKLGQPSQIHTDWLVNPSVDQYLSYTNQKGK